MAVLVAKQANVNSALVYLGQVEFVWSLAGSWQVLEQKNLEKAAQKSIVLDEIVYDAPFRCQLFLHGTYEYAMLFGHDFTFRISANDANGSIASTTDAVELPPDCMEQYEMGYKSLRRK